MTQPNAPSLVFYDLSRDARVATAKATHYTFPCFQLPTVQFAFHLVLQAGGDGEGAGVLSWTR